MSGQYFEVVGIKPFLGRLLQRADDDHPGASQAAVLSWSAWKSDFGADPDIVGKTLRLNKQPYTIVGVTPENFYGTEKFGQTDLFVPMANQASLDEVNWLESRNDQNVYSIVRLKDGVTMPQVQAESECHCSPHRAAVSQGRREADIEGDSSWPDGRLFRRAGARFSGRGLGTGRYRTARCLRQPGSLFAARTADRTREIAIRMAIGSSRWRIVRQILAEAVVISIAGGALACGLAWTAISGLANWHPPPEYPMRFNIIVPQPSLILAALVFSCCAGILFGVMPLRQIFNDRSQRCHQERRCQTGHRGTALGASRFPAGGADRALLRHRHGRLRLPAWPRAKR